MRGGGCGASGDGDAAFAAVVGEGVGGVVFDAFLGEELFVEEFGECVVEFLGVEGGEGDGEVACGEGVGGDAAVAEEFGGEATDEDGAGFGGGFFEGGGFHGGS